jgi:hypothetical protein
MRLTRCRIEPINVRAHSPAGVASTEVLNVSFHRGRRPGLGPKRLYGPRGSGCSSPLRVYDVTGCRPRSRSRLPTALPAALPPCPEACRQCFQPCLFGDLLTLFGDLITCLGIYYLEHNLFRVNIFPNDRPAATGPAEASSVASGRNKSPNETRPGRSRRLARAIKCPNRSRSRMLQR